MSPTNSLRLTSFKTSSTADTASIVVWCTSAFVAAARDGRRDLGTADAAGVIGVGAATDSSGSAVADVVVLSSRALICIAIDTNARSMSERHE
jgi:hypothetical protein